MELVVVVELVVYAPDHPGLFAAIAGAMALSAVNIVDAKVHTLTDGMALDTFVIQKASGGGFNLTSDFSRVRNRIADAIQGKMRPAHELAKRREQTKERSAEIFAVAPVAIIDNNVSNTHTVIEINGLDRAGLLYDVTSVLTGDGLPISSALVSTYGERVVDVFYVKDVFGLKVERKERIDGLRDKLLLSIAEDTKSGEMGDQQPAAE